MYIYIYIYRERDIHVCVYIYIYICIYLPLSVRPERGATRGHFLLPRSVCVSGAAPVQAPILEG